MKKKNIFKQAEIITTELYKIENMLRIIYESISYNADNGVDCGHILEFIETLNNKIQKVIDICEMHECELFNIN